MRQAAAVITVSAPWAERLRRYGRPVYVIPNGFEVKRYRPDREARVGVRRELRCDPDTPLIGLIARYDPMKDHATFLHAASGASR